MSCRGGPERPRHSRQVTIQERLQVRVVRSVLLVPPCVQRAVLPPEARHAKETAVVAARSRHAACAGGMFCPVLRL